MPRPAALPPLAAEVQQIRALLPPPESRSRSAASAARERNVLVLCRFRGQSAAEEHRGGAEIWELSQSTVSAREGVPGGAIVAGAGPLTFAYDRVFGPEAQQAEVYAAVEPVVHGVLRGVNGAVLCYGQTSAGKTFTMEGLGSGGGDLAGVIPRALNTIFDAAAAAGDEGPGTFRLTLSMLEVYMERLRDLIDPESEAELRIVEDRARGVQVCGLREVVVADLHAALEVFQCGQRNRAVAATGMNDRSSRSHSVFVLRAEWLGSRRTSAKLSLVDLAGSECLKKACLRGGDDTAAANAEIVEEAKAINQSLTTLGLVINRLADRRRAGGEPHVPYRSSKLTRVLQDTLGGSSHTVLVVNCSASSLHASETLSTLRFGARARSVVNCISGGPAAEDSLLLQTLRAARLEIQRLRACAAGGGATGTAEAAGGNWSMVSALSICSDQHLSDEPPSLLDVEVSPASRRVSRSGFPRPQLGPLWQREADRSLSPIDRRSLAGLSPLQLSPRRSLAASTVASRRVSRRSAPWSRRVSLALSEDDRDPRDADLSPLELSPGTSAAVSRRASHGGCRLSRPGPPSEVSTPQPPQAKKCEGEEEGQPARSGLSTPATWPQVSPQAEMPEMSCCGGQSPVLRCWEHPMTRHEKFERLLLVREKEVDKLQEQLEAERAKYSRRLGRLEDQLAALQTENQWLNADRMQHIEQAVRSSLEPMAESPVAGSESAVAESPADGRLWASCREETLLKEEDALTQAEQRQAQLQREHEEALTQAEQRQAQLQCEHEEALTQAEQRQAELRREHEEALTQAEQRLAHLQREHEGALAGAEQRRARLQCQHEDALAQAAQWRAQLQHEHEAALASEREHKAQAQQQHEAALATERARLAQLQEALAQAEQCRAQLQREHEAALARERESRAQLQRVHEEAQQVAVTSEANAADSQLEPREREARVLAGEVLEAQCNKRLAELQAALAHEQASHARTQEEHSGLDERRKILEEQLSSASAVGAALKEELARAQGELFVATEARQLAAERAARAERTLAEECSAASFGCEWAREGLRHVKQVEERLSRLAADGAVLRERTLAAGQAEALAAKAEKRAEALEVALEAEREARSRLQSSHQALEGVHHDLEEQLRGAEAARAALQRDADAASSLPRRLLPHAAWCAVLAAVAIAGLTGH